MKVGIMGAGRIARIMAQTIIGMHHEKVQLQAIASRSLEKAQAFAQEYGIKRAYGSYESLARDKEIDLIYIATPHSEHCQNALLCIEHDKHMLIEKAYAANRAEAEQVIKKAQARKLLAAEAIWTRYMPSRRIIDDIVQSGVLGEVKAVQANLGYPVTHKERLLKKELCGGALLDLGVYPINFALMVLGHKVQSASGTCIKGDSAVDLCENICLTFEGGAIASLMAYACGPTDRMGYVYGTKGYLAVANINNPEKIERFDADHKLVQSYAIPSQVTGYEHELLECLSCLEEGNTEPPSMPYAHTLQVMKIMDELRRQFGVEYASDKSSPGTEQDLCL